MEAKVHLSYWQGHGGVKCFLKQCRNSAKYKIVTDPPHLALILCEVHKVRIFGESNGV